MRIAYKLTLLLAAALAVSCSGGLAGFWDKGDLSVDRSNYSEQRDHFAEFAELTVGAPEKDVHAALDRMFDRLLADTVSYYVYADWVEAAFYNIYSPTRDAAIFEYATARMLADEIMPDNVEEIEKQRRYNALNLAGASCILPELKTPDGEILDVPGGEACIILVINPSCRSCASSLAALAEQPGRHIAICFGSPIVPDSPVWEYCYASDFKSVFDMDAAPFWFAVDAEGTVTTPYSIVHSN